MKQFFTLLGIVAMGATAYGQADTDIVNIPDWNFKQVLINNFNINTNKDKEITYAEARVYKGELELRGWDIKSLTGIEAFINITKLNCSSNKITSLDVSKNTALQVLTCWGNQLTSLDVSENKALKNLFCHRNQLTSLDVSENLALEYLSCSFNQLKDLDVSKNTLLKFLFCSNNEFTSLDLSKNIVLTQLNCSYNQLTSLDISENTALWWLYCSNNQLNKLNIANGNNKNFDEGYFKQNPNLMCIQIDNGFIPNLYKWQKDAHASYSDNCNYPTLSTTEVAAEQAIQILNPIKDNLVIKTTAKVERIEIYNTAGQLVKVLLKGNTQVQDLAKGIYLIKITTDQGAITEKIIKQ